MTESAWSNPLRVAVIIGKWNGYGVESLALEIARRADPKRVLFTFVIEDDSTQVPEHEISQLGITTLRIPRYERPIAYHRRLLDLFRNSDFDIVHAHTSTLAVFPLFAAWRAGIRLRVAHVHTMASRDEPMKSLAKFALRPFAKLFPTHLAMSSRRAGEWMYGRRSLRKGKVFYLPVARELELFRFNQQTRQEIRRDLGVADRLVVGHLGRFVPQKNHKFLIDVFHELRSLDKRALLLLAGDGYLSAEVMDAVRARGLTEDVLYLGKRTDPDRLYQAMDVFVLPSIYEGVPGTGVEAQAAGLPFVYSSRVTDEIQLLPSTIREPLESGPRQWAELIRAQSELERTDTMEVIAGAGFDSRTAANMLTEYYETISQGPSA